MKSYFFPMAALIAFGCAPAAFAEDTARTPCNASLKGLDISMVLQNPRACFVSQKFAERLARLVMEEKYPKNPLFVSGPMALLVTSAPALGGCLAAGATAQHIRWIS
jgi:hypothetical protein